MAADDVIESSDASPDPAAWQHRFTVTPSPWPKDVTELEAEQITCLTPEAAAAATKTLTARSEPKPVEIGPIHVANRDISVEVLPYDDGFPTGTPWLDFRSSSPPVSDRRLLRKPRVRGVRRRGGRTTHSRVVARGQARGAALRLARLGVLTQTHQPNLIRTL
jgi:hypothetical protein